MVASSVSRAVNDFQARLVKQAESAVDKALADRGLRKAADGLTRACPVNPRKPPSDIQKLFEDAADKALSPLRRENAAAVFTARLSFEFRKTAWTCSGRVDVVVQTEQRGGSRHVVRKGDTLWAIAEKTYGDGVYAGEVAKANARVVPKPDLLLVGVTLDLPRLPVVRKGALPELKALVASPSLFQSSSCAVAIPALSVEFGMGPPTTVIVPSPQVAFKIMFSAKGTLTYERDCIMPIGYTLSKDKAEVGAMLGKVGASFSVDKASVKSVTFSSTLGAWTVSLTPNPKKMAFTGAIKSSIRPTKVRDGKVSGDVAIEVEVRVMPRVQLQHVSGKLFDAVLDLVEENIEVIAGCVLLVAVGAAVVATVASPLPGDEVITYGMALKMAPAAMGMIAR